jgi:hypothetical protein
VSDTDAATAPARAMFSGWTLNPPVPLRFVLSGPDSPELSTLLSIVVMAGARVQVKAPRGRYIVTGSIETLDNVAKLVADEPGAAEAGFTLERETDPPANAVLLSEPIRSAGYRRVSEVQGPFWQVREFVARAIDYRLIPAFKGAGRWTVTGPTERQMRWAADVVVQKPLPEVMKMLGVTAGMVTREDRDGQPVAVNSIPRVSRTRVQTDDDGNLTTSITSEFDAGDEP